MLNCRHMVGEFTANVFLTPIRRGDYSSPKATRGRRKSHCRLPLSAWCLIQREVAKATVSLSWLDLVLHMSFMLNQDQLSERDGKGFFFSLRSFDYSACTSGSRSSEFTLSWSLTACSYPDPWRELHSSTGTAHANCPLSNYKGIRYLALTLSAPSEITSGWGLQQLECCRAAVCRVPAGSGALSCTCKSWWMGKPQPLSSSKEERKMLCPKPGCAISGGSEQQEELVHAVGTAASFGTEGRSREMMGRDHSARGSPVVGSQP